MTNSKPLGSCFPSALLVQPYKSGRDVLIEEVSCMWNRWICIGFEVCSKLGIPLSLLIRHFLKISSYLCIPGDCLLLWEVNLKTDNVWKLLMHVKPKQSSNSFTCRHIAQIQIELDFIQASQTPLLCNHDPCRHTCRCT